MADPAATDNEFDPGSRFRLGSAAYSIAMMLLTEGEFTRIELAEAAGIPGSRSTVNRVVEDMEADGCRFVTGKRGRETTFQLVGVGPKLHPQPVPATGSTASLFGIVRMDDRYLMRFAVGKYTYSGTLSRKAASLVPSLMPKATITSTVLETGDLFTATFRLRDGTSFKATSCRPYTIS